MREKPGGAMCGGAMSNTQTLLLLSTCQVPRTVLNLDPSTITSSLLTISHDEHISAGLCVAVSHSDMTLVVVQGHIPADFPWPQVECLAQFRLTMTIEYQLSRQFVLDPHAVAGHTILFCKVSPHLRYCVLFNDSIPIHQNVEEIHFPRPSTADSKSPTFRGLYRSLASCRKHVACSGSDHVSFRCLLLRCCSN